MAQPAPDEGASSAQAAASAKVHSAAASATASASASRSATPAIPLDVPPALSFSAINSRALSESARLASPAAANQRLAPSDPTPPTSDAVVAHDLPHPPQTPAPTTQPARTASQSDNMDVTMAETTYGTRSRNRTNARPNYAEDQEMDFEYSSAATTLSKKKAADASAAGANGVPDPKRAPEAVSSHAIDGSFAAAAKESTSGNSGSATGTSKKRKAAGTSAAALQSQIASSTPPPAGARKATAAAFSAMARETNVMTFTKHRGCLSKKGELVADDGTRLSVNDHVYLVCEPPGDPYYLCRVMEFLHVDSDNPSSPVDSVRVNWYYRPRDVQRFSTDTRLVFATMHSDMCPITSLRGKCIIKHRSEIDDLDAYRKERDSFYFVQVFDRFIRRSYECIPVQQIINVPEKVKKALDERWKFVVVEIGRVKELTSAAKTCKRCARYCASTDSVDCAICKNSYHMNCVQPPLPKKPSRGFAWACGPCSRASERQKESRDTPTASGYGTEVDEEDAVEEDDGLGASIGTTRAPSPSGSDMIVDDHPATQAEIALAKMWPMRYLGIHARVEDALQYDDRAIYPRASSRLGPRHQANVNMWHGRPVELIKPAEIKKRYNKGPVGKKEGKLTKETLAAMEADRDEKAKRPKWVQDEPTGYVARGEDYDAKDPRCTAKLMFTMPSIEEHPTAVAGEPNQDRRGKFVDNYLHRAKGLARSVGVPPFGTNFLDKSLELLTANKYNVDAALKQLQKVDRRADLHEPVLSKSDLLKFEEAVAKYGSEHRLIRQHMKTNLPHADVVRFYYLWKKTPKGREIWGNYGGRKKRKAENDAGAKFQAEVANDVDDSAFDNEKAARKRRLFQCKFCNVQHSRQWRRAPGVAPGETAASDKNAPKEKKDRPLLALCLRCAGLWRKYAIKWEEIDDASKKFVTGGGRGMKRKIDEELLREIIAANEAASMSTPDPTSMHIIDGGEPPKKKSKPDREGVQPMVAVAKKEKPPPPPKEPTPPPPPIIPAKPTWKVLPCAVCKTFANTIECLHCKLTVHRRCFGLRDNEGERANGDVKWICEQCQNDRSPMVSTNYACCLCLTEETLMDLVEPPKVSHKKKTDREREKERLEKELADAMRTEYRNKQFAHNWPLMPREPLKRTAGNNWVHVHCAVWAPEIRFSVAKTLEVAEGVQLIPQARFEAVCKLCKNKDHQSRVRENAGACTSCFQCNATFHASCAFQAGYTFGFDVQPVKGSRKDQITTATLGQETGALSAVIMCKDHVTKNVIHPMNEVVDDNGTTALQVFVENYKQADLALTGTARKAAQVQLTKDKGQQASSTAQNANRRESGALSILAAVRRGARTSVADTKTEGGEDGSMDLSNLMEISSDERHCVKCDVDVTPKWHPFVANAPVEPPRSPQRRLSMTLGEIADANKPPGSTEPNRGDQPKPQIIRFMPLGASGRAWEGMLERHGPRPPLTNGDSHPSDNLSGMSVGHPSRDPKMPREVNGEHSGPFDPSIRRETDEVYHTHALPRYHNPAARLTPPLAEHEQSQEDVPRDFLCHKCFLKPKMDPTPPPEELQTNSPPRQFGPHHSPPQPPPLPTIEQQFEVWDRPAPPPAPPPPPPILNGLGASPHYNPIPPQHGHHLYGPPPFGQQSNGFHGGPPLLHDRHSGYGFPNQPSPNPPPLHFTESPQSRPPALNSYAPPPVQQMPNGVSSPTYQHGPPQLQQLHPPHRPPMLGPPSGPFDSQMHGPPNASFEQPLDRHRHVPPESLPSGGGLSRMMGPAHQVPDGLFGRPRPEHINGQAPPAAPMQTLHQPPQPQGASPQPGQVRPDNQAPRPSTPRGGPPNGTPNMSAASASPSLANLIH